MIVYDYLQLSMIVLDYLQLSMIVYDYLWRNMTIYGVFLEASLWRLFLLLFLH